MLPDPGQYRESESEDTDMKRPKKRRPHWDREVVPPSGEWKYRITVSFGVEEKVEIDEFEKVMEAAMSSFSDEDFVDYDNRAKMSPDKEVKVTMFDMSGDMKVLMMLIPLIERGRRTIVCQLSSECKEEIVLDVQYPLVPGNQRVEVRSKNGNRT